MTFDELWGRSTPNSWARVPRGPVAVAVGSFLFGSSGVLATTTIAGVSLATIGGFLVTTAVTSWALSAKPPGTSSQTLGNVKEAVGDFDIVYGEVRKGGTITFMETSDRGNYKDDYLHMIIVLAGHEVAEIGDIYFNDEKVTIDANGFVTGNRWKSLARVKKHLGSPNQLVDPNLVAETGVDSNFRGRGIAYLYVRLDWDKDVFANGTPTITAMVKGRKVYDPRSGNTVWTDNAALCIRDYLAQPFGLNSVESPSSLGSSDWVTAANVCDILVNRKDSSSEKRFTINGVVSTANTPRTNLQNMLTSCGGTLFWGQGQWQFKAGYFPSGPYVSFDADDLRSGISLVTKNSRKENFNAVTGTFLDKKQGYIEVDYPKIESTVFLQRDNNQTNTLDMSLPYTTSSSAAQRLAKMAMFRSREEIVISADFGLKAAKVKVGDVVRFTFDRYGFDNKYFEVVSWKPTTNSGELKINLILRETSAAAYDWNAEEKDILGNNTNLPDPTSGLTINNLSVTNRQTLQSDGSLLGEVVLAWDAAGSAFIDKYVVQWKKSSDISWSATETDEISIVIPSIKSGVIHDYRVKAVNFAGFSGPWEQLTATVDGKQTPPGIPTNLQTKNSYRAVEVTWVNPTDRDLNHVEIWGGATSNVSNATLLGKSGGTKFIFNMEPMEEKWFFVRAVDNSDNKSPFTTGKKGTALFIDQSDVDIDVDQLLEDAGLNAVEVLPSLPTTGNYDGRTVYNTSDRQLYIYDGVSGTWKPAVEPFNPDDLVLDKDNFPSDLKPVEVLSVLPTTGNFEGRVVMLLSDGKIYRYSGGSFTASVPAVDLTGTIVAGQIGESTITPEKLATVPGYNLISDPQIRYASMWTPQTGYTWSNGKWTFDGVGLNVWRRLAFARDISVESGLTYRLKAYINLITATSTNTRMWIEWRNAAGTLISSSSQNGIAVGSSGSYQVQGIAPAGAKYAKVRIEFNGNSTNGTLDITEFSFIHITSADTLDTGAVDITKFASGLRPVEIVATLPTTGNVNGRTVMLTTDGKLYRYHSGAWTASVPTVDLTGTIVAGQISDNAITETKISDDAISTPKLKANAITAGKIASNAITTDKLEANAITAGKIASNAITTDKLEANAVTTAKIVAGAITANEIAANAIVASKVAITAHDNYILDAEYLDLDGYWKVNRGVGTWGRVDNQNPTNYGQSVVATLRNVTSTATSGWTNVMKTLPFLVKPGEEFFTSFGWLNNKEAKVLIHLSYFTNSGGTGYVDRTILALGDFVAGSRNSTAFGTVPAGVSSATAEVYVDCSVVTGGLVSDFSFGKFLVKKRYGGELIVDGAITTDKLFTNAVTAGKISAGAITSDKIEANAITAGKIEAGAIAADKIASNAITSDKIEANAITAGKISAGAVTATAIAANTITAGKMVTDSITSRELKAGSVTTGHITANAITAGLIAAGAVSAAAIEAGAVTADKINVNSLSAISANLGSIEVGTANIADGAIGSAKISNIIQSSNFVSGPSGAGWRIQKDGVAEFNNVIIRRTIQAASGTTNVGDFTPRTQFAVDIGNGNVNIVTGSAVNISNGPGRVQEVLTTPIPISAWQGSNKTYIATVGMTGTVNTSDSSNCYWGWDAQVLPLTKWSGNQSLRLRLSFWSKNVSTVSNCVLTWKIYEVS